MSGAARSARDARAFARRCEARGMSPTAIRRALGEPPPPLPWSRPGQAADPRAGRGPALDPGPDLRANGVRAAGPGIDPKPAKPRPVHPGPARPRPSAPAAAIVAAVARALGLRDGAALLAAPGRQVGVQGRQLAMYLADEADPGCSGAELAAAFKRDRTTVLYGIERARARLASDAEYRRLRDRALAILAQEAASRDRRRRAAGGA